MEFSQLQFFQDICSKNEKLVLPHVPNKMPLWSSFPEFPVTVHINDGDGIISVAVMGEQQTQKRVL